MWGWVGKVLWRWSGGLSSWVLSGFTPRASHTSHVQLWPWGPGQEALRWSKHSWNALGRFSVCDCVGKLWLTGGRLLSSVVGLSLNPPPSS